MSAYTEVHLIEQPGIQLMEHELSWEVEGGEILNVGFQSFRDFIPPRSRDHQPFFRPGHADVEEFHVLGRLGFREFDLAEANEDHGAEFEALAALHGEDAKVGVQS